MSLHRNYGKRREKEEGHKSAYRVPLGSVDRIGSLGRSGFYGIPSSLMSIQERFPDKSLIGTDRFVGNSAINLHETRCWPLIWLGYKSEIPSIVPC